MVSTFEVIGTVNAANDYAVTNHYQFTDQHPGSGGNFYRLSMIDLNGNQDYSAIKCINFTKTSSISIACFPNPTINYINMNDKGEGSEYNYAIYTTDGKKIQQGNVNLLAGANAQLDLMSAPKGVLLLALMENNGNTKTTIKIVKE